MPCTEQLYLHFCTATAPIFTEGEGKLLPRLSHDRITGYSGMFPRVASLTPSEHEDINMRQPKMSTYKFLYRLANTFSSN